MRSFVPILVPSVAYLFLLLPFLPPKGKPIPSLVCLIIWLIISSLQDLGDRVRGEAGLRHILTWVRSAARLPVVLC